MFCDFSCKWTLVVLRSRSRIRDVGMMGKKTDKICAFLGQDTAFEGKLSFKGAVRIDGRFSGEIETEGTLIVGQGGEVQADIRASRVLISGIVRGDIVADEKIDVLYPGKVFGNIEASVIRLEEGVVFKGNCTTRKANGPVDGKVAFLKKRPDAKNEI